MTEDRRFIGFAFGAISAGLVVATATLAICLLVGCSPAPARSRVTPGTASVDRTIVQPSRLRIEVRQPPRVYVPTPAEAEGGER